MINVIKLYFIYKNIKLEVGIMFDQYMKNNEYFLKHLQFKTQINENKTKSDWIRFETDIQDWLLYSQYFLE